ncbi:MAG TPA: S41 family peptidase [Candidatus Saccharimonadales bacterium]
MHFRVPSRAFVNIWLRRVGVLLGIVVIFFAGVEVGNGRIYNGMFAKTQSGLPAKLDYASVNQIYQLVRSQYDGKLTETQLLDGIKTGLVNSLNDPYSEYFTPSEASQYNDEVQGSFSGIGAELGQTQTGAVQIIAPISGSPAAKAGVQAGDIITAINGKSTNGMSADTAVNAIRGKSGTKVTLTITRGAQTNVQLTITRANIVVPSVTSKILPGNIGYMQISQFTDDTASLASAAAQSFANAHVRGVVLDLRDNPGGLVDAAVSVSSLWLNSGQNIMQAKAGSTVLQTYTATGGDTLHDIPTVVLVNSGTASAAEITAAALHDNKDATILGEKTYGKGVMQQLDTLPGGAELKVTIASWYRPNGKNINHLGITPDKIVAASPAGSTDDAQEAAAIALLTK